MAGSPATAPRIRERLAADFTDWKSDHDKFEREFEKVVRALKAKGAEGHEEAEA